MAADEVLKRMGEENIRWVDLQFVDIKGFLKHVTLPIHQVEESAFKEGLGKLDGSAIKGFKPKEESELLLVPDPDSYARIPWENNTVRFFCELKEPFGKGRFAKDPRLAVEKAEDAVKNAGFTAAYLGPSIEFYVFDAATVDGVVPFRSQGYSVDSREAAWNSYGQNFPIEFGEGHSTAPPQDTLQLFRSQVSEVLEESFSITVESHHHEAATAGQCGIGIKYAGLKASADNATTVKFAVKNVAAANAMVAVFLPKPMFGDNGNGMHLHQSLWKGEKNAFYDDTDKYAEMSQTARYYVGGILEHANALCAITNPTTNSYKRLLGEDVAPFAAWGRANGTAAVRIPIYHKGDEASKRIEYRIPDASSNPYLAFAAVTAAGLDGIKKKKDCGDPVDDDVGSLDEKKRKDLGIRALPRTLEQAIEELESDKAFLKSVFSDELLQVHVELKKEEVRQNAIRPTPYEYKTYMNI